MAYDPSSCPYLDANTYECQECDAVCIVFKAPLSSVSDSTTLVMAVRGTHTIKDALCDLQVCQSPLGDRPMEKKVMVHSGFKKQALKLAELVKSCVESHLATGGALLCVGHSLGAGVATVLAAHYGISFPGQVSFIGYGTPRQGNNVLAEIMSIPSIIKSAIRVKNHRDPVCASIPRLCAPYMYEHSGIEINIHDDPFPDIPDPLCLPDHMIESYITALSTRNISRDSTHDGPLKYEESHQSIFKTKPKSRFAKLMYGTALLILGIACIRKS